MNQMWSVPNWNTTQVAGFEAYFSVIILLIEYWKAE